MAEEAKFTINIHTNDDVKFEAQRIASTGDDFVALKIGWQASVFLMNPMQAKALALAAQEAYSILKTVQIEQERAEMARAWEEDATPPSYPDFGDDYSCQCSECVGVVPSYEVVGCTIGELDEMDMCPEYEDEPF